MNLRGFKREGEYHYFKESAELRGLHRYAINHFNKMIFDKDIPSPRLIPANWHDTQAVKGCDCKSLIHWFKSSSCLQ